LLAFVAHNVAKLGLISGFFTGKTVVFCSENSQPPVRLRKEWVSRKG
jgi:hypothetical protein